MLSMARSTAFVRRLREGRLPPASSTRDSG